MIIFVFLFTFSTTLVFAENLYRVQRVDDGDTIVLSDKRRVRYIGINAPEIEHKWAGKNFQATEPFGDEAKKMNMALVQKKNIRIEQDEELYDRYGRLLAYIFLEDGIFVNERMLQEGLAYCLVKKPNNKYEKRLLKAQQEAMTAGKGIWRHIKKGERRLGNKRSKRFHKFACPFGKQTRGKNHIWFASSWDAFFNGFAPCKKCFPTPIHR